MKLSKTGWLFLGAGIFAILAASLGVAHSQQASERSQLTQGLSMAQLQLQKCDFEGLSSRQEELERSLARVESQLRTSKNSLSQSIESIEASDALYDIAKDCGVEITEIHSSSPNNDELEGVSCAAVPLTVQVEGDLSRIVDFIHEWTRKYPTGMVRSVAITVPEVSDVGEEESEGEGEEEGEAESEEEAEEESEGQASARINMLIYTYGGN